jgi:antitoxin VapB
MQTAKLFTNGRSQAVRLPREFRFQGDDVFIKRVGTAVVLLPRKEGWDTLEKALAAFEPGLVLKRRQPRGQRRERLAP